jgi:DNA polymerase
MGLFLYNQIKIIRPKIICTLGASATQALLGEVKITKVRGKIQHKDGIDIVPTFHPAYILRNASELPTFVQDLAMIIEMAGK